MTEEKKTTKESAAERKAKQATTKKATTKPKAKAVAKPKEEIVEAAPQTPPAPVIPDAEKFADEVIADYEEQVMDFVSENSETGNETPLQKPSDQGEISNTPETEDNLIPVVEIAEQKQEPEISVDLAAGECQGLVVLQDNNLTSLFGQYFKLATVGGTKINAQVRRLPHKITVGTPKNAGTATYTDELDGDYYRVTIDCPDLNKFCELLEGFAKKASKLCPNTIVRDFPRYQMTILTKEKPKNQAYVRCFGLYSA